MTKSFHELHERLLHAGVAPRHVRRYLFELTDHLADLRTEEERAGRNSDEAEAEALLRLGSIDDLAKAITNQPQFQSWCVRAPWATFGLAPLLLLAAAYGVALFILWSGWKMFLPGVNNPFVKIDGLAVVYFGIGRSIYFGAPAFVASVIAILAARQRLTAIWPILSIALVAVIGCMARVHATPPRVAGGMGHVHMGFSLWPSTEGSMLYALIVLSLTALPYLLWQLNRTRSLSA